MSSTVQWSPTQWESISTASVARAAEGDRSDGFAHAGPTELAAFFGCGMTYALTNGVPSRSLDQWRAPVPHQLFIICRARFPSKFGRNAESNARQGSRCSDVSVKRQDGFGISPRSGLSGQNRRQLALIRLGDSLMSVVPSIIVLVITALLVFRRELTTRPAAQPVQRQH